MSNPNELYPRVSDEEFYPVIERLKAQGALPRDSFVKEIPFFTFRTITKETQIMELFQDSTDPQLYKNLLKNIVSTPEDSDASELITKRLSVMQVMSFAQIVLYKVLPCPNSNCPNRPREIATHNQYKDYEYQCPFYHHERDRRRIVITPEIGEEFVYKANYFEEGKRSSDKEKYSANYFESMFHPLYYKMFRCKREYCNFSQLCPFYHSEDEKKTWDKTFSNYIRKDRISYVKDKQKYYEKEDKRNRLSNNSDDKFVANGKSEKSKKGNQKKHGKKDSFDEKSKSGQPKKWDEWGKGQDSQSESPKSSTSKDSKESSSEKYKLPSTIKVL